VKELTGEAREERARVAKKAKAKREIIMTRKPLVVEEVA